MISKAILALAFAILLVGTFCIAFGLTVAIVNGSNHP